MCTAGIVRLGGGDYLLFKNKDFGRSSFDDRLVIEREVFGASGVTTWAEDDPDDDNFSGISFGANSSGVLVCDTNVLALADHSNYDDLVEIALRQGTDVASCIAAVRQATKRRPYMWANLMLIDSEDQAAIEVRGNDVVVGPLTGRAARTNHHLPWQDHHLDPQEASYLDDTSTSLQRLAAAERHVAVAATLEDVFALLRTHDDGDTGICNHTARQTVYSYVLRRRQGHTKLHVIQGKPCTVAGYEELDLPLGSAWSPEAVAAFRSGYPSRHALAG